MKRLTFLGLFLALGGLSLLADNFWRQLTEEERRSAGLDQLSPAQQAALDQLADRYAGEGARRTAEAVKTETKAKVEKELKARDIARFGLEKPKGAVEAINSRIIGAFNGWSGKTLFRLENGQSWMQADASDRYWVPTQPGPEVEVSKSPFGGWKLTLVSDGRWVRVKRVN